MKPYDLVYCEAGVVVLNGARLHLPIRLFLLKKRNIEYYLTQRGTVYTWVRENIDNLDNA